MKELDRLHDLAVHHIRAGWSAESVGARSDAYRAAAEALVAARRMFTDRDGNADLRGRTYAYRTWTGEVLGAAGVPPEDRSTVSAAIRYHVGNVVRETSTPDELSEMGLLPEGPRERSAAGRAERSEMLAALTGTGLRDIDALRALAAAKTFLDRVPPSAMTDLDAQGRKAARQALRAIVGKAGRLQEGL